MAKEQSPRAKIDLINRIASKDKAAFSDLYDLFSQVVFNLAVIITKDEKEAEEVVQDVFLQIWNRASSYDENRGSPLSWLIGIARNRAIDKARSIKLRGKFTLLENRMNLESHSVSIIDRGQMAEKQMDIRNALGGLPKEQRTAIEMAYFSGMTHSEIAQTLEEPLGTIKTRIRLGIEKLRKSLSVYFK